MTAQQIARELSNWPQLLHPFQQTSTRKAVVQILNSFLPFLALWTAMYLLFDYAPWASVLLGILNAFFLVRIFIIQHDCGHKSFIGSQKAMKVIGHACSLFSMIPFSYWAKSHEFHHAHNGQLEHRDIGDITVHTVREYSAFSKWKRFQYRVYRSPLVMFLLGPIYYILIHNRLPLISLDAFKGARRSLLFSNALFVVFYLILAYFLGWQKLLLVQGLIVVPFAVIAIWFFYVQHQHELAYKEWKDNWHYLLSAIRGSSFYKLPRVINWLTGSIGYHHIHHLNPRIPNYNLKRCHEALPYLEKYITILNFRESLQAIHHKLWDEDTQRMITFREFKRRFGYK